MGCTSCADPAVMMQLVACCVADRILLGRGSRLFIFRIVSPNQNVMEIACDSEDELKDWMNSIRACTDKVHRQVGILHTLFLTLFVCDIQASVLPIEIHQASGDQSVRGATHYDITMDNDVVRCAHCDITLGNDVTRDILCNVTMSNDIAMCTYHCITMHNVFTMNLILCITMPVYVILL